MITTKIRIGIISKVANRTWNQNRMRIARTYLGRLLRFGVEDGLVRGVDPGKFVVGPPPLVLGGILGRYGIRVVQLGHPAEGPLHLLLVVRGGPGAGQPRSLPGGQAEEDVRVVGRGEGGGGVSEGRRARLGGWRRRPRWARVGDVPVEMGGRGGGARRRWRKCQHGRNDGEEAQQRSR